MWPALYRKRWRGVRSRFDPSRQNRGNLPHGERRCPGEDARFVCRGWPSSESHGTPGSRAEHPNLNEIWLTQVFAAFLLLCVPWGAFVVWRRQAQHEVPLSAIVSSAYWLYFAVPLFWGNRTVYNQRPGHIVVSDESITLAAIMAV